MTRTKKILIVIAVLFLGLFGCYKLARWFSPGSYPFAEHYELNYSEAEIINAINTFKSDNLNFLVPKVTVPDGGGKQWDLNDGRKDSADYWYHIYFYYKDQNKIIYTWTRQSKPNKTTFAFVSVNDGLEIGHWKNINDDFGFLENRKIKKEFEDNVLNSIQSILTRTK